MRRALTIGVTLVALASGIAACGGGGGGGTHAPSVGAAVVPTSAPSASPTTTVAGKAVFTIPNRSTSSAKRKPAFVSASAVSLGMSINGGPSVYSDISATSTLCTTVSGGRTCTIPVLAPPGNDTFVVTLYDAANGGGNVLGTSTATQSVTLGTPFTLAFAASGKIASVAITVPVIDVGPTSVPVTVTAKDADGNTIIGPDPYPSPITLTDSDTTGVLTLSTTTANTPNDVITLAYSGGALTAAATISATASGVAASAITPASVLPYNYFPVGLSRTYSETTTNQQTTISLVSPSPNPSASPTASPAPTSPPYTYSSSYTQSIAAGATFNGQTGLIATSAIDSGLFLDGFFRGGSTATDYMLIANGVATSLGNTTVNGTITETFVQTAPYSGLPFVPGAMLSAPETYSGTDVDSASTYQATFGRDASGNYTYAETDSDASTYNEVENSNGSATLSYGPGTGTCTPSYGWNSGLPCGWTSATETVSAPASGSITVTVSQVTGSGPQSGTFSIPASEVYPNGLPTAGTSDTTLIGAPISAPPAPCNVTVAYQGPIIPITVISTFFYSGNESYVTNTFVAYLAPAIGPICETEAQTNPGVSLNEATETPPLSPPTYGFVDTFTETDSLTAIGPPLQIGTIITNGRSRAATARGGMMFSNRFSPGAARAHGNPHP